MHNTSLWTDFLINFCQILSKLNKKQKKSRNKLKGKTGELKQGISLPTKEAGTGTNKRWLIKPTDAAPLMDL